MELNLNSQMIETMLLKYYEETEGIVPTIKITCGRVRTSESYLPPRIAISIEVIKIDETIEEPIKENLSDEALLEKLSLVFQESHFTPESINYELDRTTNQLLFKINGEKTQENKKTI